jgi:hypothetical protein
LIQPLDEGVIKSFKNHHQNALIESLIDETDENNVKSRNIDILDALKFSVEAWKNVTSETIVNCFDNAFKIIKTDKPIIDDAFI